MLKYAHIFLSISFSNTLIIIKTNVFNCSEKSRHIIHNILDQVKTLSKVEKLLLYLKLPTEYSNTIDPLRQPLNPLGSRSEIHRTISWIKTHLEEDQETSLPKQDVYDNYSWVKSNILPQLSLFYRLFKVFM